MVRCTWRQAAVTPTCPDTPRLDGTVCLVTGGNAGIGREISRGLAQRGGTVLIAARNAAASDAACRDIGRESGATLHAVTLDLANLESVVAASEQVRALAGGRGIGVVVANAAIWPTSHQRSAQGHELAFAVNLLGHHLLIQRALAAGQLTAGRVVLVTGDIYVRARECTPDFTFTGPVGGALAYSRSKLGVVWLARELQRHVPRLEVCAVHPGVIDSGLVTLGGLSARLKRLTLLDVAQGAQTPLWCATQPGVGGGGYFHNTMGRVLVDDDDPAADSRRAAELWDTLETLTAPYR